MCFEKTYQISDSSKEKHKLVIKIHVNEIQKFMKLKNKIELHWIWCVINFASFISNELLTSFALFLNKIKKNIFKLFLGVDILEISANKLLSLK